MGLFSKIATAAIPALIGGGFSAYGQRQANEATQASTQAQMDFQREMRATQYQASMADMRAAGLNPMLAYQQGGAGTPSGASYTAQNEMAPLAQGIESGVTSALVARKQNIDIKKVDAEIEGIEQTIRKMRQDTRTSAASQRLMEKDAVKKESETNLTDMLGATQRLEYGLKELSFHSARAAAAQSKTDQKISESRAGRVLRWIDRTGQSLNPFADTTRKVTR